MIRRFLTTVVLSLFPIVAAAQTYTAILTGAAVAPSTGDPDGIGVALITIEGTSIRYSVVTQNIGTPTKAHLHSGPAGHSTFFGSAQLDLDVNTLVGGIVDAPGWISDIARNPAGVYVDVHTSDHEGGAIRGQLREGIGARPGVQWLPVVGKVAGAAGTNFVTGLRIVNLGAEPTLVGLEYFPESHEGRGTPIGVRHFTVVPGEQRVINDVIAFLDTTGLIGSRTLGTVRVTSDQPVKVLARVLNDLRHVGEGTTGFAYEARGLGEAALSGTLGSLSASTPEEINAGIGFRTNIGYANPYVLPVNVDFVARRSADGSVLGRRTVTITGMGMVQWAVFDLLNTVPEAERSSDFYVTWTAEGGPIFVYAAVVDNRTGDAVLVQD